MADVVSEYVAWSDNANDYADEQREKLYQTALEDIDNLMNETGNRDAELWDSFEIDSEVVVSDYDDIEPTERDLNWTLGLSALAAASGIQFFLDNREALIINPAAYRAQVLSPYSLTESQLVRAGKREVISVTIDGYQTLQSRYVSEFSFLKSMDSATLFSELQEIRALQSFDKYASDAAGYVSRMTSYPKGSPQFKEAVSNLINFESKGAQTSMNRRSIESLSIQRQTDGNLSVSMAWILDPNSKHCSYCPARAGDVLTLGEWYEIGIPGAEVCAGGDKCNCHLERV